MAALFPRVIIVTRPTELTGLVEEHGTLDQACFAVREQGRDFDELVARDAVQRSAVAIVQAGLAPSWRRARIDRSDLASFAFDPGDVVVAIGQDGLVPNVAKYLDTQIVVGVNPDPRTYEGILVKHSPLDAGLRITQAIEHRIEYEERTMVEAVLDDGQHLRALNEVFVGHQSHQSARYRLMVGAREERQSSSGLIVSTGTGATGWARSIARERALPLAAPSPTDAALVLYVREAFAAPGFGTTLTSTLLSGVDAAIVSEMTLGGVIFGDGIEGDFLRFPWGQRATIRRSTHPLRLAA